MSKNVPRGHWSLAQVTRILRDDERRMHSAEIKIKAGVYVCPVTKLCLLEGVQLVNIVVQEGRMLPTKSRKAEHLPSIPAFFCYMTYSRQASAYTCVHVFCIEQYAW